MKRVAAFAVLGVLLNVVLVLPDVLEDRDTAAIDLIQAGADGPSAAAVAADFDVPLPPGLGHDGQQFYAIARNLTNLTEAADHVDHPSYRMQRIAFPALAWALHPTGGGAGLVWAMVAVNVLALLGLGLASGWVALRLGGPPWIALAVLLLPGAYYSLRIATADALAMAFTMAALAALLRERPWWAAAMGTMAVLTRESALVLLVGFALAWRDRRVVPLVVMPAAAGGLLYVLLRAEFGPGQPDGATSAPLTGLWRSIDAWADGRYAIGAGAVLLALLAAVAVVATVPRAHPLYPAVALQLLATLVLGAVVLGPSANGTRSTLPLATLALVAIFTKDAEVPRVSRPPAALASSR